MSKLTSFVVAVLFVATSPAFAQEWRGMGRVGGFVLDEETGQPIEGVADVQDSVVIQRLSEEKARLQGEKAQRSATLLANQNAPTPATTFSDAAKTCVAINPTFGTSARSVRNAPSAAPSVLTP